VGHTTDAHALLERLDSAKPTNTEIRSIRSQATSCDPSGFLLRSRMEPSSMASASSITRETSTVPG